MKNFVSKLPFFLRWAVFLSILVPVSTFIRAVNGARGADIFNVNWVAVAIYWGAGVVLYYTVAGFWKIYMRSFNAKALAAEDSSEAAWRAFTGRASAKHAAADAPDRNASSSRFARALAEASEQDRPALLSSYRSWIVRGAKAQGWWRIAWILLVLSIYAAIHGWLIAGLSSGLYFAACGLGLLVGGAGAWVGSRRERSWREVNPWDAPRASLSDTSQNG